MSYVKDAVLDIILPLSNPRRFKRRAQLFHETLERLEVSKGKFRLWPVEGAFGEREYEVEHPYAIRVRLKDELWQKENLINIALSKLPEDSKYVAWVDADVQFMNPNWIDETIEMLQHHPIVQPWSHCIHMGPDSQVITQHKSFGFCNVSNVKRQTPGSYGGEFWHPGFAWAARVDVLQAAGGLIDWSALGAGDHHMALAMIGKAQEGPPNGLGESYYELLNQWQSRIYPLIQGDVGYVKGTILHHWHGRLADRKYQERWVIMQKHKFDPRKHLKKNMYGVLEFTDEIPEGLVEDFRNYFKAREEDANTMN